MKDFFEKYGMGLRQMRAYIRNLPIPEQNKIYQEIQSYFNKDNKSHKYSFEK